LVFRGSRAETGFLRLLRGLKPPRYLLSEKVVQRVRVGPDFSEHPLGMGIQMSGGMEILRLLYLALGPGIALAVYIYYSDKWEPEPKALVIKSFILGGLACFPSYYYEDTFLKILDWEGIGGPQKYSPWWHIPVYAFFGVALAEELCKFLFLKAFICDNQEFSEPFDGLVYGGMVGCGFATVENLLYVLPLGQEVGIIRMFTAVPGHVFEGMILGYFMGRAKFSLASENDLMKGLGLVVVLHGIYDTAAFSNGEWSFLFIFAIVFLGLYLGLRAKKELAKHSAVIEFSTRKYTLLKKGRKKRVLVLREIRDQLADGKLKLEDLLVVNKTGKTKTVKEIFSSGIVSQYVGLIKIPPRGLPVKYFLLLYGLTFGFYFYFWFLRNYRNFRDYKRININPEIKTLVLFSTAVIPYFIYGVVLGESGLSQFHPVVKILFDLVIAGVQAGFLFFQLRIIKRFLKRKLKGTFSVEGIVLGFFIINAFGKLWSPGLDYYWFAVMILVMCEGIVLTFVQKDLNLYWKRERMKKIDM
jgi:RsiW-degrading membrane proteinase PrsW (M82 family)